MHDFHKPFVIGLRPLDLSLWFDVDDKLNDYLVEKDRLYKAHPELVFAEEDKTHPAQQEILDAIVQYLCVHFPETYRLNGNKITLNERQIFLSKGPPLLAAARLVQDDLVLMRKSEAGWRLVAASLCFPSSWSLVEKFGKPLTVIHEPVPGFGPNTRNATMIERIFDNLPVEQPVWRQNWSLYPDGTLYHPATSSERTKAIDFDATAKNPFIRVERQTLRKMPISGDILFTIRIYVERALDVKKRPGGAKAVAELSKQLKEMSKEQRIYKNLPAGFNV